MPKSSTNNTIPKTDELLAAMQAGREALRRYLRGEVGRQTRISRISGILAPVLSRMSNKGAHINLEAAILLEVASEGGVRAEVLCPERAEVLNKFLQMRATSEAEA